MVHHKSFSKFLRNYIIHFIFLFQVCISVPYVKYILISCGDIKINPGPKTTSDHNLSVCYWNLNGITTNNFIKKSLLEAYNTIHNYDIICISETFLNSDLSHDDSRLSLQGYELIRCDNPNDLKRGGICIYFKEHLPLTRRTDVSPLNESIICEITINNSKCFITCLYRSPSQSSEEFNNFCSDLETTLTNISLESPLCSFIFGDFNAKCTKWWSDGIDNTCGLELDTLTTLLGYSQLIHEPTNFEPNKTPSCIDLIFASQPNLVSESGVQPSLYNTCHHQIIYAKINFQIKLPPPYKRKIWHYKNAEADLIRRSIESFNWENELSNLDTNDQVMVVTNTISNIFNNFIPNETIKCNYKEPPWMTKDIKCALRRKNRCYRKYISNGMKVEDHNALKDLSTFCTDLLYSSK